MAHQWHTLAHNGPRIKNSSFDSARPAPTPHGVLSMDMEIHGNTATWKYSLASEHEPGCRLRPGLSRFSSERRSRANPKITKITKIKRITVQDNPPPPTPHSQLQIPPPPSPQSQRDDSSLRPTTETAEAGKGRGPRFSSGRRGRATPPTRHSGPHPSFRPPTRHSGESRNPRTQTNHSSDTPALALLKNT